MTKREFKRAIRTMDKYDDFCNTYDTARQIRDLRGANKVLDRLLKDVKNMDFDTLCFAIQHLKYKRCDNCINTLCTKRKEHGNAIGCTHHVTQFEAYGHDFDYGWC